MTTRAGTASSWRGPPTPPRPQWQSQDSSAAPERGAVDVRPLPEPAAPAEVTPRSRAPARSLSGQTCRRRIRGADPVGEALQRAVVYVLVTLPKQSHQNTVIGSESRTDESCFFGASQFAALFFTGSRPTGRPLTFRCVGDRCRRREMTQIDQLEVITFGLRTERCGRSDCRPTGVGSPSSDGSGPHVCPSLGTRRGRCRQVGRWAIHVGHASKSRAGTRGRSDLRSPSAAR